jgi:hypothetical protein
VLPGMSNSARGTNAAPLTRAHRPSIWCQVRHNLQSLARVQDSTQWNQTCSTRTSRICFFTRWYLVELQCPFAPGISNLLLDSCSTHWTDEIETLITKLKVTLHYIPPDLTNEFQLLDQKLFAVLKAEARHLFRANLDGRMKQEAITYMIITHSILRVSAIKDAWDICTA